MKQQANKSFFGLKWLAVLIATLFLVGIIVELELEIRVLFKEMGRMLLQLEYKAQALQ